MRILIADDHVIVRKGLQNILLEEYPHAVLYEASSGSEALEHIKSQSWDLVILDINMPDGGGLRVLENLQKLDIKQPVLVLSMHHEEQFGTRVRKLGASGYLDKETATEDLIKAVKTIFAGEQFFNETLAQKLGSKNHTPSLKLPHETLSQREFLVFQGIVNGRSMKEIAADLNLSNKTVSTYRTRTLEKLNASSNSELVQYAMRFGLIG